VAPIKTFGKTIYRSGTFSDEALKSFNQKMASINHRRDPLDLPFLWVTEFHMFWINEMKPKGRY